MLALRRRLPSTWRKRSYAGVRRGAALALCVVAELLFLSAIAAKPARAPIAPPPAPKSVDTPAPPFRDQIDAYGGAWACRYGDSPVETNGARAWAAPALASDAEWRPCAPPKIPPGRAANNFLWMRTRLTGAHYHDPTLFLLSMDQIFEAYLDGKLIYRFGVIDGDHKDARRYAGHRPHYLPLGSGYQGKLLALRIYSAHINIGIVGTVKIGGRLRLTVETMRGSNDKLVTGAILIAMGLASFGLFLARRKESIYALYGGFASCVGIYLAVYSQTRTQVLSNHLMWNHIEQLALFLMTPCFLGFMIALIGRGPFSLTAHLQKLHWGFVALALLLILSGIVPLMAMVVAFQVLLMFDVIYVIGIAAIAAAQGNVEARIFTAGLALPAVLVLYDLLAGLGVIPRPAAILSHFGVALFVAALALIPIRRVAQLQKERERTLKLEAESQWNQRRVNEQAALLDGMARMAAGDLSTPITTDGKSPLRHLGETLDAMRRDLREKLHQLEESHAKVRSLNEELMRQIEQRSRRLLELLLGGQGLPRPQHNRASASAPLAPGSLLGDIYRVIRGIGQGAAGAVYEVERTTDGHHLAAKVLSSEADETSLIRFAREAQLLSRLNHPNLISILDVDVSTNGTLFIVMELVKGTTLRHLRPHYGDPTWALPILRQIAIALTAVHERGIIHRDLKPANVLCAEGPAGTVVKLADFGVSVMARRDDPGPVSQRPVSPLVALLTGEVDENEPTESSLAESDFDDLPTNERDARRNPKLASAQAPAVGEEPQQKTTERGADLTEVGAIVGTVQVFRQQRLE
jgi:hypothetical protein